MFSLIVACAENNVIGKDNKLLWHISEDLKYFKEVTMGKTIFMGRKTFESLPFILPGRKHIVLTTNKDFTVNDPRVEVIHNLDEIIKLKESNEEIIVIGGAQIYSLLMDYCDTMYITEVHEKLEGDAFFPEVDDKLWIKSKVKDGIVDEKNEYPHTFYKYSKI